MQVFWAIVVVAIGIVSAIYVIDDEDKRAKAADERAKATSEYCKELLDAVKKLDKPTSR